MKDVRIRKMSDELHSKLKITAIEKKTTLNNLVQKILADAMGLSHGDKKSNE